MKLFQIIFAKDRAGYFSACIGSSLTGQHNITVVAMDSTDDTQQIAVVGYSRKHINNLILESPSANIVETMCRTAHFISERYEPADSDILYLCADDYEMHSGWFGHLMNFMSGDISRFTHGTLELEPAFPWNTPKSKGEINGVKYLSRLTAPIANIVCSFGQWKRLDWFMSMNKFNNLCDHALCKVSWNSGKEVFALNLADHIGAYNSSVGNQAFQVNARPLQEEWKI